jgi:hypothetical protein
MWSSFESVQQYFILISTRATIYRVRKSIVDCLLLVCCCHRWDAVRGKFKKTGRQRSKQWRKWGVGGGWALCCHEYHLPPTHSSELCVGHQHGKILEDLSKSKNIFLNVKWLLNDGMGLMPQRRGERSDASGMSAGFADLQWQ